MTAEEKLTRAAGEKLFAERLLPKLEAIGFAAVKPGPRTRLRARRAVSADVAHEVLVCPWTSREVQLTVAVTHAACDAILREALEAPAPAILTELVTFIREPDGTIAKTTKKWPTGEYPIGSEALVGRGVRRATSDLRDFAEPFFARARTLADLDALLHGDPESRLDQYLAQHWRAGVDLSCPSFAWVGLAVAKLAGRRDLDAWRRRYRARVRAYGERPNAERWTKRFDAFSRALR